MAESTDSYANRDLCTESRSFFSLSFFAACLLRFFIFISLLFLPRPIISLMSDTLAKHAT